MKKFLIKFLIISIILLAGIFKIESVPAWAPLSGTESYTHARWNSFYEITEKDSVDILIMGNSRSYNGINPKQLSCATSSISFTLGSPGTTLLDTYFSFKETLKRNTPKLLIIETYCINGFDFSQKGPISYMMKSFNAKKDLVSKLQSTPHLFKINDWPSAWMNSIRNHNYLLDEDQDLSKNIKNAKSIKENTIKGKDGKYAGKYTLYLGKFNGNNGLKKEVLDRYKKEGPLANDSLRRISEIHLEYLEKLYSLCKENNVELMFLTIPVFNQSIKNHHFFIDKFNKIISPFNSEWLDLQADYDTSYFLPKHFDNVYKAAHHTTADGSYACTKKLVEFINLKYPKLKFSRNNEQEWINKFYGTTEYFVHHPILEGDKKSKKLLQNVTTDELQIYECGYSEINPKLNMIWSKIKPTQNLPKNIDDYKIRLQVVTEENKSILIDLPFNKYNSYKNKDLVFSSYIKPLGIKQVTGIAMVKKNIVQKK